MEKAQSKALEKYPINMRKSLIDSRFTVDENKELREGFIEGFTEANKENPPLTGEDMKKIYALVVGQYNKYLGGDWEGQCWGEEFYNEVLNAFNQSKNK